MEFYIIKYFFVLVAAKVIGAAVHIESMQLCEKQDYAIMWGMNLKDEGNQQVVEDGFMETKIDVDNDVLNKIIIYKKEGENWNQLVTKTDGTCIMAKNFMGEFINGLENAAGMKQTCPYTKGKYQIKNYPLDFSTFKYKDFPPGTIKIRSEFYGKNDSEKLLSCYEAIFTMTA